MIEYLTDASGKVIGARTVKRAGQIAAVEPDVNSGEAEGSGGFTSPSSAPSLAEAGRPLHPATHCGKLEWSVWFLDTMEHHYEAYKAVQDVMKLWMPGDYTTMTDAERSAFRYSIEDRIKWLAAGREVKRKGRKRK